MLFTSILRGMRKNVNFYAKECPSDRKDDGFPDSREREGKREREREGKDRERVGGGGRERESTAACRSINPFAVIATRSRYIREIKFRVSLAHISLLPGH